MRLSELEPKWLAFHGWSSDEVFHIGIGFLCPHCRAQRLCVIFANPIDPSGLATRYGWTWTASQLTPSGLAWQRTGDTYDTLSLTPSIDVSKYGHWHGFITNGEVT